VQPLRATFLDHVPAAEDRQAENHPWACMILGATMTPFNLDDEPDDDLEDDDDDADEFGDDEDDDADDEDDEDEEIETWQVG
jgi:hypothetical protein